MSEKYCKGCGILLQDENMSLEGYTTSMENDLCKRCFRLKNYGEYQVTTRSNEEYVEILKDVSKTKDLVLYIVDLLNLEKNLKDIRNYIKNPIILVLNKRDVLPKSVNDQKLIEYIQKMELDFLDIVVISSNDNYNIDMLLKKIRKYQKSKNVYVAGHTNAGKSTFINALIKNYSSTESELTISPLPSTTLNMVEIEIDKKLKLIDTPGLIDRMSIIHYVDPSMLKKISPKKEIKPRTYQIRRGQSIIIEDFIRIDYVEGEKNSFTLYISNDLKVKRLFVSGIHEELKDLYKSTISMKYREDLVINGLGFVKIMNEGVIDIYLNKDVEFYMRDSLI